MKSIRLKTKELFKFYSGCINDLLTGLLGPYWEIQSPIFFVRLKLARALCKSEGFVFLVRTEQPG